MAVLFPIKIGDFRFFVNPTEIEVRKRSQISETRTMAGTVFQVWPDLPDEVSFSGIAYGFRAISELRGLQSNIQRNPDQKKTSLVYKYNTYEVYIKDLTVSASADDPRIFKYKISLVLKERFKIDTMPIGQLPNVKVEFDFFSAQLRSAVTEIASLPADIANGSSAIFGQLFGKTGSATHGLGIFIGRPRSSPFLKRAFKR